MIILIFTPACMLLGRIVFVMYICHQYLILLVSLSFTLTFFMTYFLKIFVSNKFHAETNTWWLKLLFYFYDSDNDHIYVPPFKWKTYRFCRFSYSFYKGLPFPLEDPIVILRFFCFFMFFFLFLAFLERYFSEIFDCFAPNFHDLLSFIVATD